MKTIGIGFSALLAMLVLGSGAFAQAAIRAAGATIYSGANYATGVFPIADDTTTNFIGSATATYLNVDVSEGLVQISTSNPSMRTAASSFTRVNYNGGAVLTGDFFNNGGVMTGANITVFGVSQVMPAVGFTSFTNPTFPGLTVKVGQILGQSFGGFLYGQAAQVIAPSGLNYVVNVAQTANAGQALTGGNTAPEPGTLALIGLGIVTATTRRRRK